MSRVRFAVTPSWTTLRMRQAVICRSRGGFLANEKEDMFASNDNWLLLTCQGSGLAGNPLPPYPFFCQERYPFRTNHRLKAHFVDYCFVSKYFRQQSLYKQHIRSFSLRKSSMPLSHRLFPSPTLAAHPKTCHFFKNTTWASTRQYDEYPGCVTMLHLAPPPDPRSLFEKS